MSSVALNEHRDLWVERDRWFWKRYRFRPSRAALCPRVVAGRRCLFDGHRGCLCRNFTHGLLDHAAMWLNDEGHHVMTIEPYDFDHRQDEFRSLVDALVPLRLVAEIQPEPQWHEKTTLILIRRAAGEH